MITTLQQYKDALIAQRTANAINVGSTVTAAGREYDLWRSVVPVGAIPATPAVCTRSTLGALGQENPTGGLIKSIIGARANANGAGVYIVVDRLSHQGGLNATIVGTVTTNLPTAALPRYADGEGVMLGVTIYTQIGTTASTISVTYTNPDGVGGRVTPLVVIGGTGFCEAGRMILLPLQDGDTGVRSVESRTQAATTGIAGAYGVTLFKPIAAVCVTDGSGVLSAGGLFSGGLLGGIPQVLDDACLSAVAIVASVNAQMSGVVLFAEH